MNTYDPMGERSDQEVRERLASMGFGAGNPYSVGVSSVLDAMINVYLVHRAVGVSTRWYPKRPWPEVEELLRVLCVARACTGAGWWDLEGLLRDLL